MLISCAIRLYIPLFCALYAFAAPSISGAEAAGKLRIGFIGGFTGPGSIYGAPCKQGFDLALNRENLRISVLYEDDQFIPSKTVSAFHKLVQIDRVDAVIVLGSVNGNAIAPLARQSGILTLVWAGDPRVAQDSPNIVQTWVSGKESGTVVAREASRRGINRVGFVIIEDDHPQSVLSGFRAEFHGAIGDTRVVPPGESDFRGILARFKSKGLRDVGLCLGPGQSALLARQARAIAAPVSLFGCETLDVRSEVEDRLELEGVWFARSGRTLNILDAHRKRR